jgi:ubiquitin-activating enzyme E1 C
MEVDDDARFSDVNKLLTRVGPMANEGTFGKLLDTPFDPDALAEQGITYLQFIRSMARVLVVGAGGLGCELLKDLALMGFGQIDVIDMDTIDISNLNRQFLFRKADVGRPKATVAAEFVMKRVAGVTVTPHYCPIQDKDEDWYRSFQVIVMGLDSIEARRWLNAMACGLVRYETDEATGERKPDFTTVIPLVDGGTEGFSGHVRTIIPGVSSCFECTLDLFPPQQAVPLCTIAETPRNAAHCILYAHLIEYPKEFPDDKPDKDDPQYQNWVYTHALARAKQFSIPGVTLMHTQGVIKNIIPAIASTNAIVAAACASEAFKLVTSCCSYLDNNLMYMGGAGLYAPTFKYERQPQCVVCGQGVVLQAAGASSLTQLMELLGDDPRLRLKKPSLSVEGGSKTGETAIYMRGILESHYAKHLDLPISNLFDSGSTLVITDPSVPGSVKVTVQFTDEGSNDVDVADAS